jgi:hypothetical protein
MDEIRARDELFPCEALQKQEAFETCAFTLYSARTNRKLSLRIYYLWGICSGLKKQEL